MKRFTAFILSLIIALASGACAAESTIQFRGIPWKCDKDDFEKALTDDGISWQYDETYPAHGFDNKYWPSFAGIEYSNYYDEVPQYSYRYHAEGGYLCTVAGYKVSNIYADFLPGEIYLLGENKSMAIAADPHLYRASYQILVSEESLKAFEELEAKLTMLYGEPTGSEMSGSYLQTQTTYWLAEDGTGVSLELTYSSGLSDWIMIEYAYADDENRVSELSNILESVKMSNTDGL